MEILKYYHPDIEIVDDKYIYKRRCTLWDKDMDIESALSSLKETNMEDNDTISLYDAYTFYCSFQTMGTSQEERPNKNFLVSKSYFEKYIRSKES